MQAQVEVKVEAEEEMKEVVAEVVGEVGVVEQMSSSLTLSLSKDLHTA